MGLRTAALEDVRERLQVGDIIAFGGRGPVSWLVKQVTAAPVSHVGILLADPHDPAADGSATHVMEAHPRPLRSEVHATALRARLDEYGGDIWWLPLGESVRRRLDPARLQTWLVSQEGKRFDLAQGILSAFDRVPWLRRLGPTDQNLDNVFCSELVVAGLVEAGAIAAINPSVVTPAELVAFRIYADDCWQLRGGRRSLRRFNQVDLDDWAAGPPGRSPTQKG